MDTTKQPTGWGGPVLKASELAEIETAAKCIDKIIVRTPLVPMHSYEAPTDIWLKPEVLQPIGSFKLRGVYNWAASLSTEERQRGLGTTSSGNTAQALGYVGRLFGVRARSVVPDWLPENKMESILKYGVTPVKVPPDELWAYMLEERWRREPYSYLNPWGDPKMLSGHGTIGLEIYRDLPDIDTVYVPVGGGALISGIGSAIKALKPDTRVVGVQALVNPALAASFDAGGPTWIQWKPTISEGASTPLIVDQMYPLLRQLVDDIALISEEDIKAAIKRLAMGNKLVVEGAGALSVAAALSEPRKKRGKTVCIVSGGSIDTKLLKEILSDA